VLVLMAVFSSIQQIIMPALGTKCLLVLLQIDTYSDIESNPLCILHYKNNKMNNMLRKWRNKKGWN